MLAGLALRLIHAAVLAIRGRLITDLRGICVCKRSHRRRVHISCLSRMTSLRIDTGLVIALWPAVVAAAIAVTTLAAAFRVAIARLARCVRIHRSGHRSLISQCLVLLGSITFDTLAATFIGARVSRLTALAATPAGI